MAHFRPFNEGRRALPLSIHSTLLHAVDAVMALVRCLLVVSQPPNASDLLRCEPYVMVAVPASLSASNLEC